MMKGTGTASLKALLLIISAVCWTSSALRPSQYGNGRPDLTPPHSNAASSGGYESYNDIDTIPSTLSEPEQQSVEERLESWRQEQQYKYEHQTQMDQANPRDGDGRMKLLASVSRGSISIYFFILMWRSIHHFELADQSFKGVTRLALVFPTIVLFVGNLIGCAGSVLGGGSGKSKKRMKAILNLNKLVELILFAYNVLRLSIFPSKFVIREVYVGRSISNFIFMTQCQLFTKVTWGAAQMKQGGMSPVVGDEARYAESPYGQEDGGDRYPNGQEYYQQQQQQQQQQQYRYDNEEERWN